MLNSSTPSLGETTLRVRLYNCDVTLFLYDGYDWAKTRKTIEDGIKEMRRRLAKIRQLVASGQKQDPKIDEQTSTLLFNSVYVGLEEDVDGLDPGALIAAIDDELNDDLEIASQSSWQSLRPASTPKHRTRSSRIHGKRLTRSRSPSIEIRLVELNAEVDHFRPGELLVSRTFITVRDAEILDHIKTSTWKKFLTELRSDVRGNVRETDSNMIRAELRSVRPVPEYPAEEARLRVSHHSLCTVSGFDGKVQAKILPLRLYVDQDALDFLKKFFSFQDPQSNSASESNGDEIFFRKYGEYVTATTDDLFQSWRKSFQLISSSITNRAGSIIERYARAGP
jgi:autophagy-related protein 2